jgi:hypothetical protein
MLNFQPDIVQQQILVRVSELQLLVARNQLLPQLNLNLLYQLNGLGQHLDSAEAIMTGATLKALDPVIANKQRAAGLQTQPGMYNDFVTWQAGFTFQMPLGMRGPLANTRTAQYQLLRQRAFLQQVVHQTTHSLARFFLEIDANYKQFKTASRLRAAAAERLNAQRAFYEEGRITIDRFLDAVSQYATAVATEAQYKTTYNISIVALEEAKGTLLAYDNVAVAEGPWPSKAYVQARDIQNAHHQHHIPPDGPQLPRRPVGPLNPDPVEPYPPPGVEERQIPEALPGPAGPRGPRPTPVPNYTPAETLPRLSGTTTDPGSPRPTGGAPGSDVSLTSGAVAPSPARASASLIDTTVPGMGSTSVAASLGRTETPAARTQPPPDSSTRAPKPAGAGAVALPGGAQATPSKKSSDQPRPKPALEDLPPLPVSIDLPPLPPG